MGIKRLCGRMGVYVLSEIWRSTLAHCIGIAIMVSCSGNVRLAIIRGKNGGI
jgi:hypothetical protein